MDASKSRFKNEMEPEEQQMETDERVINIKVEFDQDEADDCMESLEDQGSSRIKEETDQNSEYAKQLFIGGLQHSTTETDLQEYFSGYGTVVECVVARDKPPFAKGNSCGSKGFGFVTMSMVEEAEAILKETHMLQGRVIVPAPSRPVDAPGPRLRLCLCGLNRETTTKESLLEYFTKFGEITEVTLSMQEVDGKMVPRGFGIITMESEETANAILKANIRGKQVIDGADVEIKHADRNQRKRYRLYIGNLDPDKTTKMDIRECFRRYGFILELDLSHKVTERDGIHRTHAFLKMSTDDQHEEILQVHRWNSPLKIHDRTLEIEKDHDKLRRICVEGLDMVKTTESDLRKYFSTYGEVQECTIVKEEPNGTHKEGPPKGYAIISMSTVVEADAVLKHTTPLLVHHRILYVNRTETFPAEKEHTTKMNVITCIKTNKITEQDLRDYFSRMTNVKSVILPTNKATGEKMGYAVMELDSHHDVDKFALIHDHFIKDNRVVVTKCKKKDSNKKHDMEEWGRGRGGWGGGWDSHGEYGDGYYEGLHSDYGWMRGRGIRGRGRGRGWGGPGSEIWGDGYFGDGGRFGPRGNRRGWGRHRGRPY